MDTYTRREIWKMTFNEAFKHYLKRMDDLTAAEERGADPAIVAGIKAEVDFTREHMERENSDPDGTRRQRRR